MGRWWIAALLILDLMGVIIIAARQTNTDPDARVAAVLPAEDCHCWQGIQAGITSYKDARNIIANLPHVTPVPIDTEQTLAAAKPPIPIDRTPAAPDEAWRMVFDEEHQYLIHLDPKTHDISIQTGGLRLGDVIAALGVPDYYVIEFMVEAKELKSVRVLEFFYGGEHLRVTVDLPLEERLAPATPVTSLHYEGDLGARPFNARTWVGFVRLQSSGFGLQ